MSLGLYLSLTPLIAFLACITHTHPPTHTRVGGSVRGATRTGYYGGRATRATPVAPRTSASRFAHRNA